MSHHGDSDSDSDSYGGDGDGLAVMLRERLHSAGPALTPAPAGTDLVDGARRRYRRQRLASMAAGVGALACLAGVGLAAAQWLQPSGQAVDATAADGRSGTAAGSGGPGPATTGAEASASILEVGGLPFTLPSGYEPVGPVEVNDLTPSALDPTLPGGVSMVGMALPPGGQAVGLVVVALYKGPVAEEGAGRDDATTFGSTPAEHITIAGHDARLAVVAGCGDRCFVRKPTGGQGGPVRAICDTVVPCAATVVGRDGAVAGAAPFPHVDLHVALGPDAYLVVDTAGISRDDVVELVTDALEAGQLAEPSD